MFPIRWNFPFRKKDGSISTIGAEIEAGGGGGGYTLPTASAETKGGIKIGSGLTMTGEVLSNNNPTPYSLPTASSEVLGGVKVGSGLTITDGVLSNDNPTPYSLPTASSEVLGGIKVGSGLSIDDGVLSATGGSFSPTSGQITVGNNMNTPTVNQLYKFGNMVCIEFIGTVNTTDGVQTVVIGDLPEGFRPSALLSIPCVVKSGVASYYDAYISISSWEGANKVVRCSLPSDLYDANKRFDAVQISGIFTL